MGEIVVEGDGGINGKRGSKRMRKGLTETRERGDEPESRAP